MKKTNENQLICGPDSAPPGTPQLTKEYGCRSFHRCAANECPLCFATYDKDVDGRLIVQRRGLPGDPQRTCHVPRELREAFYRALTPEQQALLPNKGLQDRELREDAKLAAMPEPERVKYLKDKEESRKRWLETMALERNKRIGA